MSGDVQPRKRKDKKRKKEEESTSSPPLHLFSKEPSEDVNIHIHKEEGTGGGICAKIVFFILFSALIVLIGLIITEHRGLTDLDVAESESKYSQIFEGWVDDDKHDDHHTLDDHDNEHFDDEEQALDDHTLDDHDNEHLDDEETNEQSEEEHTLDDHDNEHFDDDQSSPLSKENEYDDTSQQKEFQGRKYYVETSQRNARYRRELSEEHEDDDNITDSQQEQEDDDSSNIYTNSKVETDEEAADSKDEGDSQNDSENIYEEDEENSKIEQHDDVDDSAVILEDDDDHDDSTDENDPNKDSQEEEEDTTKDKYESSDENYPEDNSTGDDDDDVGGKLKRGDLINTDNEDFSQEAVEGKRFKDTNDERDYDNTSVEKSEQVIEKSGEDEEKQEFIDDNSKSDDENSTEKSDVNEKDHCSRESTEENIIQQNGEKLTEAKEEVEENQNGNSGGGDNIGNLSSNRTPSTELDESDSEKLSDDYDEYEYSGVTNKNDWPIRKELDEAERNLPNNAANALKMFEKILEKYPSSPRGFYGLAQAFDALAETEKSNEFLDQAISKYLKVSELRNVPDKLYKAALERCIDRTRFRGKYGKAIMVHFKLIDRFTDEPKYRNQLAITYLTIGKVEQARLILKETLQKWPNNGCALVHYGFIWKTNDNNLEKGVYFMQKGIDSGDSCVIDGRFYFHLGDGYSRLGDKEKALKIYEDGVRHKLFLSKYQRSLYNVPRLTARPWWHNEQIPRYEILFKDLEKHWLTIRNEGLAVLNQHGYFQDESENLRDTGDWKQLELFARGRRNMKNCNKTPFTCKLLQSHPDAKDCRRGQTKFSVMHPGTHVWAHCGPTNCRLRVHLGLKVPPNTYIRVADDIRSWEAGKLLIFDDSFEHEVWHNGTEVRLVLIIDVWHPELTMTEKETLSSL